MAPSISGLKTKKEAEPVSEEPAAKKAKAEEEPKAPKFQEPDAAKVGSPLQQQVIFEGVDTTLNVVPTLGGKVLATLGDGGMSYLVAGARANTSQKSGRYMFEAKILQATDPLHGKDQYSRTMLRIGFSTASTSLVMGEKAAGAVYFDSDGAFVADKARRNYKQGRFGKDAVVGVVLNLDSKSPNFNTIALYKDGVEVSDPFPLPESLKGKPLFPHVCFRSASVHVNFGANHLKELPFKCHLLQGAAAADVSVTASRTPKDGKYEIAMPVAFPDEGTFAWVDSFLEKNPQFVELSDRKIVEWARASGLWEAGRKGNTSNDKPTVNFGIPDLDNLTVKKVIASAAPIVPRNYLIMEVKSNLVAAERKELLKKFNYPYYKKVARVVMGEPSKEFKAAVQNKLLKDKQAKSDNIWRREKSEKVRLKNLQKAKKEADKKKADIEDIVAKRKVALEEKKKKDEEAKKAKEGGEDKKEDEKEEEKKEEEKKEDDKAAEPEEPEEEEDKDTEPPAVELTEEEKGKHFYPVVTPDLAHNVMNSSFGRFSTPELAEGFDDIQYEWQKAAKATEYLQKWVLNKKLTSRMEDIKPGQYFKDKVAEFAKLSKEWQDKLTAFKAGGKKAAKKADGEGEDIDIFSVTDVCDVGGGAPLFENFTWEDWELMKLRFELCVLTVSFKKDANDEDRTSIPIDHLAWYYNRYYGKGFQPKNYGLTETKDVVNLLKDTVSIKDSLCVSTLGEDIESMDAFLKLTEQGRRERERRLEAGDETARLKFVNPAPQKAQPKQDAKPAAAAATDATGAGKAEAKGKGKDKGKDKGKGWGKDQKGWGKGKW